MSDTPIWECADDGDLGGVERRVGLKGREIINTEKNFEGKTALITLQLLHGLNASPSPRESQQE